MLVDLDQLIGGCYHLLNNHTVLDACNRGVVQVDYLSCCWLLRFNLVLYLEHPHVGHFTQLCCKRDACGLGEDLRYLFE